MSAPSPAGSSFTAWLLERTGEDSPVGDLARDAELDDRWPDGAVSEGGVCAYLERRGACPEALEAARDAFRRYRGAPA